MKNIIWKYGLLSGGLLLILMYGSFILQGDEMDFSRGEIYGYATMIISLSMIFVGVKNYRDKNMGGVISFGKAFTTGLYIALIASAIYVIAWMFYSHFFAQDFMEQYYQYSVEQVQNSGLSAQEVDEKITEMERFKEMYKNPFVKMGFTFIEIFPIALIVALISAFILKKKPAV